MLILDTPLGTVRCVGGGGRMAQNEDIQSVRPSEAIVSDSEESHSSSCGLGQQHPQWETSDLAQGG